MFTPDDEVIVLDWQAWGMASGLSDLAYFLNGSFDGAFLNLSLRLLFCCCCVFCHMFRSCPLSSWGSQRPRARQTRCRSSSSTTIR